MTAAVTRQARLLHRLASLRGDVAGQRLEAARLAEREAERTLEAARLRFEEHRRALPARRHALYEGAAGRKLTRADLDALVRALGDMEAEEEPLRHAAETAEAALAVARQTVREAEAERRRAVHRLRRRDALLDRLAARDRLAALTRDEREAEDVAAALSWRAGP